jgi:outer membrane protein OmpA-like peptidoglycan-associated protein
MMSAAGTTRQFGGAFAVMLAFAACAAAAEQRTVPGIESATASEDWVETSRQPILASIAFAPQAVELDPTGKRGLTAVAARLAQDPRASLAIVAYAGSDGVQMSARRISLGRAISVRSFLIEHGVESRRMIVRVSGKPQQTGAADRVDILWPLR